MNYPTYFLLKETTKMFEPFGFLVSELTPERITKKKS